MATTALSRQARLEAIAAFEKHGNVTAAALSLGLPRNTYASRLDRARQMANEPEPVYAGPRLPQTADECWDALDREIGRTRKRQTKPPTRSRFSDKRIVVAGDFHAPFQHTQAVATMLAETEGHDELIVNGDLQDFYAISRFTKYDHVPIEREMAAVDALLGRFAGQFPDVLIVDGNHDRPRFEKHLRQLVSLEIMHVIEALTGGNLSLIKMLAKPYQNVRFSPIKVGAHSLGWCAQEGDLIVSHAERSSRVPSGVTRVVDEWLTDQHEALGLEPWRVLIQAHTHQMGQFPWRSDKMLIDGGCMCEVHSYQLDSKVWGRGQRLGYVTLTQRDGVTDMRSVRFHWLDPELRLANVG